MRLRLSYGSDPLQFGDLHLPFSEGTGRYPVVIVIHGGFWRALYDLEYMAPVCDSLAMAGAATWNIEYRRIGNPGGGWPGTLEDVAAAARHLHAAAGEFNLDLNRVITMGHSAGGHLALWLGSQKDLPLAGAVSLAGVADLRRAWELQLSKTVVADFLGGGPDDVPDRYDHASPIERLPLGIPQRLFHGTADQSVPLEISERYIARAKQLGDNAELIALENSGHFELVDARTKEFAQVQETVLSLLGLL